MSRYRRLEERNAQISADLRSAERALDAAGYGKVPSDFTLFDGTPILVWRKNEDQLEIEAAQEADRARAIEAAREEAVRTTRLATLEAVIEALELRQYGFHKPGEYHFSLIRSGTAADLFWADIQTTLEVRAECKRQEDRDATEAKVAGLEAASKREDHFWDALLNDSIDLVGSVVEATAFDKPTPKKKGGKK